MNIFQVLEVFMSGYNGVAVGLSSFFSPEILPELNAYTLDIVLGFLADITISRLMGEQKSKPVVPEWAWTTCPARAPKEGTGHVLQVWHTWICCTCTEHLHCTWAHLSLQEILHRNRRTWACCWPSPLPAGLLSSQVPSHPCPGCTSLCWACRAGLLCHSLHQSSAPALNCHARQHLQTKRLSWYCKC